MKAQAPAALARSSSFCSQRPAFVSNATLKTADSPNCSKETTPAHLSQIFRNLLLRSFEFAQEIIQFFIGLFKRTPLPAKSQNISATPPPPTENENTAVADSAELNTPPPPFFFFKDLPLEPYLQIQKYLGRPDLLKMLGNFIIPTRLTSGLDPTREEINSPDLRLALLLRNVPPEYQYELANQDEGLQKFILDKLTLLWERGQFKKVIEEPAIFQALRLVDRNVLSIFLQRHIQGDSDLQTKLFNRVELSRKKAAQEIAADTLKLKPTVQEIAANALELLVKAGISMSGRDLQGICVPGADLSYGKFGSAQLQGANLKGVKFYAADLRNANLSGAWMTGVQFAEWYYLQADEKVHCCAFSPDGTHCALGLEDCTVQVYDTSTWNKVHILRGHEHAIQSIAYASDGKHIASCSNDETLRLWDAQSGKLIYTWIERSDSAGKLAFVPNHKWIVTAATSGWKGRVYLRNAEDGKVLHTLGKHEGGASDVACSPDGTWITSCGQEKNVQEWHVKVWKWLETKRYPSIIKDFTFQHPIESMIFSPNNKQLAFAGHGGQVYVWDLDDQDDMGPRILVEDQNEDPKTIKSLSYSPDGAQIAAGTLEGTVQLWSAESGALLYTFKAHGAVTSVVFSPDGTQIAAGTLAKVMQLWEVPQERESDEVKLPGYSETLNISGMQIQGVRGLNHMNERPL